MDLNLYWGDSATKVQNHNGNLRSQLALNCIAGTAYNQFELYGYDSVNRLTSVVDNGSGSDSSQTYGYDPYGNMFLINNIGSLPLSPLTPGQGQIDASHNRLATAGTVYDADGNLLTTGSPQLVMKYDGKIGCTKRLQATAK